MNRTKLVRVVFCVGCMVVTVGTATASASFWLVSGKSLTSAQSATVHGAIFLETLKNKVECTGLFVGTVGPGAEDLITEVNNLSGGEKDLLKNCKNVSGFCFFGEFEVHAIHLPWETKLELIGSVTWDAFIADGKGNPGWELLCALGTNVKCESETEKAKFEGNGTNGAKFAFKGKESGEAECSNGEIGVVTSNGAAEVLGFTVGAGPEWQINKKLITVAKKIESETPEFGKGEPMETANAIRIEDSEGGEKAGSLNVVCPLLDEGTAGPGAVGSITKIVNSKNQKEIACVLGAGSEACGEPRIEAIDLPWKLELIAGPRVVVGNSGSGQPGWKILCKGVVPADKCKGEFTGKVANVAGSRVEVAFDAQTAKEPGVCSKHEKATGITQGKDLLHDPTPGEELSVM